MKNYIKRYISNFSDKNIIISGANGYIGKELVSQLTLNKIKYTGIDKRENEKHHHAILNLQDSTKSIELISNVDCDYFIHAGTHSAMAYSDNFLECFYQDLSSLRNIFIGLKKSTNCRLIYFSSSYVYSGISREVKVDESFPLTPTHNFGLAKSFFEQIILRNHPNCIIFRLSSVFGGVNSIHPNAITNMIHEAKENNFLTLWGQGERQMQYIFIEDVVKYILLSFYIDSGTYNLGAHDYKNIHETSKQIAQYFGIKVEKLSHKKEGVTLPFMQNNKIISATSSDFSLDITANLNKYLLELEDSF